jgi:hypothetical protein
MAQVPETRPVAMDRSLPPANDIRPQVGVYYDAAGNPQRAYMYAPPPGTSGSDVAASNAVAVSPSDSVNLATPSRSLYVGGAGNVTVVTVGGQTITFTAVPAGSILPIQATRVNQTATTATNIISLS